MTFDSFILDTDNRRPGVVRVYAQPTGKPELGAAFDFNTSPMGTVLASEHGSKTIRTIHAGRLLKAGARVSDDVMAQIRACAGLAPASQWMDAFADFADSDMPRIPAGFADSSWHNDMCPSFTNEAAGLVIWVDYADPAQRELPELERFTLQSSEDEGTTARGPELRTDNWSELLKAIAARIYPDVMKSLHHEFMAWTLANGLDGEGDALELLMTDRTPAQREWLQAFVVRWDAADEAKQWGA